MLALDFGGDPNVLDDDEIADIYGRLGDIRKWVGDIQEEALRRAYSEGRYLPGWKVVLSGGRRVITDPDAALERLTEEGIPADLVTTPPKLAGLGVLDSVAKKSKTTLQDLLGDLLTKSAGSPALVPVTDKRPAISALDGARGDFDEVSD